MVFFSEIVDESWVSYEIFILGIYRSVFTNH